MSLRDGSPAGFIYADVRSNDDVITCRPAIFTAEQELYDERHGCRLCTLAPRDVQEQRAACNLK